MIKGNKVNLRAIESEDVTSYHNWINDESSNQTRGLYHPTSLEDARSWMESNRTPTAEAMTFVIDLPGFGAIGLITLRNICPRSGRGEISVYIGRTDQWRKGYGRDAISPLVEYAFTSMNLHRVWLECDAGYESIVRAAKSFGFIEEGRIRDSYYRHGSHRDTLILGLLRPEWSKG